MALYTGGALASALGFGVGGANSYDPDLSTGLRTRKKRRRYYLVF
jgi:hypothetical protein